MRLRPVIRWYLSLAKSEAQNSLYKWLAGLQLAGNFLNTRWNKISIVEQNVVFLLARFFGSSSKNSYKPPSLELRFSRQKIYLYRYYIFHRYHSLAQIFVSFTQILRTRRTEKYTEIEIKPGFPYYYQSLAQKMVDPCWFLTSDKNPRSNLSTKSKSWIIFN